MGGGGSMGNNPKIRYTIIEAHSSVDYIEAGMLIHLFDESVEHKYTYEYRPKYISKGIVVSVWEDGKLKGYLG